MKLTPLTILPLLATLAAGGWQTVGRSADQETYANGYIRLYLDDANGQERVNCVIPVQNRTFNLDGEQAGDPECNNNDTHYFKLENVPSATFIEFYDDRDCTDKDDDYYFRIKTIKNPTTMAERVALPDAAAHSPGEVIVPGIVLIDKQGGVDDDLSCIRMQLSPTP